MDSNLKSVRNLAQSHLRSIKQNKMSYDREIRLMMIRDTGILDGDRRKLSNYQGPGLPTYSKGASDKLKGEWLALQASLKRKARAEIVRLEASLERAKAAYIRDIVQHAKLRGVKIRPDGNRQIGYWPVSEIGEIKKVKLSYNSQRLN